MDQECPLTMPSKINHTLFTGHNKAKTTNTKLSTKLDHKGQQTLVAGPNPNEMTAEPQEHECHEEILSIQIDDMLKSTYDAKVSNTEATALFDSGTMLSCISK